MKRVLDNITSDLDHKIKVKIKNNRYLGIAMLYHQLQSSLESVFFYRITMI